MQYENMYHQTKETIALKKKQIEENQSQVNNMAFEMSEKVKIIFQLRNEVELLDRDICQLQKQDQTEMNKTYRPTGIDSYPPSKKVS